MFDRTKYPPLGYLGGLPGAPARVLVNEADVHPKGQHRIGPGDVFTLVGPGGGGFFEPAQRDPALVLSDVRDELISVERARDVYRVVIVPQTWTVDEAATARLRAGGAAEAHHRP
jgi:N-methylhydantoinase B/oxoprolinase/acetone carboxylase alpha subunit